MTEEEKVLSLARKMGMNENDAAVWYVSPWEGTFGSSPAEVVAEGYGDELISWLELKVGDVAGPLF